MWRISSKRFVTLKHSCTSYRAMDVLTAEQRRRNMQAIKSKNTKPETIVRKLLFSLGYRYRLYQHTLPGTPDIVLPKYRTVIFVHGCFWHRHKGCKYATTPSTNGERWNRKFQENIERDKKQNKLLHRQNWHILTIWECEVNNLTKLRQKILSFRPMKKCDRCSLQ